MAVPESNKANILDSAVASKIPISPATYVLMEVLPIRSVKQTSTHAKPPSLLQNYRQQPKNALPIWHPRHHDSTLPKYVVVPEFPQSAQYAPMDRRSEILRLR